MLFLHFILLSSTISHAKILPKGEKIGEKVENVKNVDY